MSDNTQMIFLSMYLPAEKYPEAGQKLAYGRLKEFSALHDVHLISFANSREISWLNRQDFSFCKSICIINLSNWDRLRNLIQGMHLPFHMALRYDKRIVAAIKETMKLFHVSRVHIEYEQGALYGEILNPCDEKAIVLHDVVSQSISRYMINSSSVVMKWIYSFLYHRQIAWEKRVLEGFNEIIVLNEKDGNLVADIFDSGKKITVDYPRVGAEFHQVDRSRYVRGRIMFWGAMNRNENADAVRWFLRDIFPLIRQCVPFAEFYVVGANPPGDIRTDEDAGVVVTGFVENPVEYFESSHVMVAPLRYGAGIKLKVLEGLATGMKVIGTTVAAEGVNDSDGNLVVCDDIQSMVTNIVRVINE